MSAAFPVQLMLYRRGQVSQEMFAASRENLTTSTKRGEKRGVGRNQRLSGVVQVLALHPRPNSPNHKEPLDSSKQELHFPQLFGTFLRWREQSCGIQWGQHVRR